MKGHGMNYFEMEMLLKTAFHHLSMEQRRKVMLIVPLIYNKYVGEAVMEVRNGTSERFEPITTL